ncbi:MAG: 1-(5-phosphoribosyl)-5-[(5-phosphoribosylamino)methylideneamino] imidazole-4-carboxamide isomerase [Gaiellales bacterium]
MDVIPAIDLVDGRVVRLVQGRFDASTDFGADAEALADRFAAAGARWLHVIDLDAARTGRRSEAHRALLARLVSRKRGQLQLGGGFRTAEAVEQAISSGVDRVLVGTLALRDPEAFTALVREHGEHICLTADSLEGSARVAGWLEDSGEATATLVRRFDAEGVSAFLVTAIDRDGTLAGPDLKLLEEVRAATTGTLLASGGIGSADDVRRVAECGCDGVVIGRALLAGTLEMADALAAAG